MRMSDTQSQPSSPQTPAIIVENLVKTYAGITAVVRVFATINPALQLSLPSATAPDDHYMGQINLTDTDTPPAARKMPHRRKAPEILKPKRLNPKKTTRRTHLARVTHTRTTAVTHASQT